MQIPASPLTWSEYVVPSALQNIHYIYLTVWKRQLPSLILVLLLPVFLLLPIFLSLLFTNLFPVSLIYKHQGITPWFDSCSCCYGVHTVVWSTVVNSYTMMSHLIDMVFVQPHPWQKKSVFFSFKCLLHCSGKKLHGTERYIIYWSCVVWMCVLENELKQLIRCQWSCKGSTHPFSHLQHILLSSTLIMSWKSRSRATEIISNYMHIWLYSTQ